MTKSSDQESASRRTAAQPQDAADVRDVLDFVFERTGMDFRDYAFASIRRRVQRGAQEENLGSIAELLPVIRDSEAALRRLIVTLTLPVTAMFRDPQFFAEFRRHVVPILRTHPYLRLWIAGCSTGQEVYSLAIVLHEEGLYERSRIYATDVQATSLARAEHAILPIGSMQDYTRNYQAAGGRAAFSDYYTADSHAAILRPFLKQNVIFGMHNLVTDGSFNEFQVIFCRNVMIYFNAGLQQRVHNLLYDSLATFGYLGLGRSESLRFSPREDLYETVSRKERLYRKIS